MPSSGTLPPLPIELAPKAQDAADSGERRFTIRLSLAVLALNLFIGALVGVVIKMGYDQQRQQAISEAQNLSSVLRSHMGGIIAKIDLTLLTVADEIARQERTGGIDAAQMEELLRRHDSRLPETLGLRVVDAKGIIRFGVTGIKAPLTSVADHPHFARLRGNDESGLIISPPILGRAAKVWMITLARRLTHQDGSFAGVVHVALPINRLVEAFAAISTGSKGAISLWNDAPAMIARVPDLGEPEGIFLSPPLPSPPLREIINGNLESGTYIGQSGSDNIWRTHSAHRIGTLPLWIAVGLADDDTMADWRLQARILAGAAILFALGSVAAAFMIRRNWRTRHRSASAIEEAHIQTEEARRRLELILGSAGEGICGVDPQGRITFMNPAARRMLGWGDNEGIGLNLHDEVHHHRADGSDFPAVACPVWQTLHDGNVRHVPRDVHWRRDGTPIPVEFTTAPIIQNGQVVGAVTLFRDIARRIRAETEAARNLAVTSAMSNILRHSLEDRRLEEILRDALVEILCLPWLNVEERGAIFLADPETKSLRMVAEHNMMPSVVRACSTIDMGHCLCGIAAERRAPVFASHMDERHQTRVPGMHEHGHYCIPIMNGADVLGVLNAYVGHGHQWQKEEERFLAMVADTLAGVIRRKQIEQTLKDSEELSKTLLNATIDGALLLDPDGRVLAANEAMAARFAKTPELMAGNVLFDFLPPHLGASRRVQFDRVLADKTPFHSQDERDGAVFDNRIYPVQDGDGGIRRVAVFSRDITQQRAAQQAIEKALADLARSNAELEQFAYVASHDLREPLRAITGHLQLLQRLAKDKLDDYALESLIFAVDGARRMDALIRDLLDYSRIGHADREMETLELGAVIADALANLSATIADSGATVTTLTPMPHAHGNRMELIRLFQNLIGNALKYSASNRPPVVEVSASARENAWDISIHDNGIGIAPENFERIFMIFQRLHGREKYEGTGIGLAVCRKIVDRHGGAIRVESEPDLGSTFTVTLPAVSGE
ncbi:Phytochrome two-component sensor histidine kinase Cyanobacterial phytochrome B [Paramagnetospirillum magnetotacticum MS-1]|uniref:histidine kinase n=1 Tax=Paramagnetospirillum magnetotacticum MS-1 TaxID=272627 RepID=A0A0C2UWE9_PARME|nr:PAS domain-containing protein [Paramagnetospirillum magnetotacticum]KIL97121.1 Phytochrome two-component sensor histidine kinase Cyanobacterial phytochrome B [Paramagnetospirillum magnetotacticum MS-1]